MTADAIQAMVGDYGMVSSTTVPSSDWGYTKGRVSIRQLDDRHVLILLACEWKDEPKAVCGDHYFARQRDGAVYLQDMNTGWLRLSFDPAARRLTMVSEGAHGKVRRDVYAATSAPLEDRALVRRMKREEGNAMHKENLRVFGHYSKWTYEDNRIEFRKSP